MSAWPGRQIRGDQCSPRFPSDHTGLSGSTFSGVTNTTNDKVAARLFDLTGNGFEDGLGETGFRIHGDRRDKVRFNQEVLILTDGDHIKGGKLKQGSRVIGLTNSTNFIPRTRGLDGSER